MGANTAIQLVLYLIQNNSLLFNGKFKCIISGMSNILNEKQQILLNNNSNILLFMNGFNFINKMMIDHYYDIYKNDDKIYYPFIYLCNNYAEDDSFLYKKINEKSELIFETDKIHRYIHDWNEYYKNIKKYLESL